MKSYGLYESASVKIQILKTAIEVGGSLESRGPSLELITCPMQAARMLLRVDDVVQATRKDKERDSGGPPLPEAE